MDLTDFMVDEKTEVIGGVIPYTLTELANKEWKNFAIYTVEARAIPNMIDGMKPVNRFYLYSSIKNTPREFKKVESVGGQLPDYGYNHGTTSGQAAGQLMAAEWANNIRFVQGEGSFGTRLVPKPAAPRYTKTRLHADFHRYVKDTDLAPVHDDPEHLPPAFYLPIIPTVLVNGIRGIATGFATNILPRDPEGLVAACKEYIETGKISTTPCIKFPQFEGTVVDEGGGKYTCYGKFERKSKTVLTITEVPYGYDREDYIKVLNELEEKDLIVGYDDLCDKDGFRFDVKLKVITSSNWSDEETIKQFKLSKSFTENLTVIDFNGRLREYEEPIQLIKDFCEFRSGIVVQRIAKRIEEAEEDIRWHKVKEEFITAILDEKIVFKGKNRDKISANILDVTSAAPDDCDRLLRLNISSLTKEMVEAAKKERMEAKKKLTFWQKTTAKEQFLLDLSEI